MIRRFPGQAQKKKAGCARDAHGRQQGFTLLEVMVSLSLMVVLFSLLYGGFRFGYQAWNKVSENTIRASEYQSTYRIVGGWLSRFYPAVRSSANNPTPDNKRYAFYGTRSQVYFTSFMPSYPTRGGLYEVLFSLEKEEGGDGSGKLTLNRRFFDPEGDITTAFDPDQQVILLEEINEGTRFEYFGRKVEDLEPLWHRDWFEPHSYPTLIRLRFSEGSQSPKAWPDLLIPITVNHDSICIYPRPDDRGFCDAVRLTERIEKGE